MSVACFVPGVALELRGSQQTGALTHALPFDDPQKTKRTAKG